MVHNLALSNSLISQYLSEMRDEEVQRDSLRFRTNLERIGSLMAYEISKTLEYEVKDIQTPLAISQSSVLKDKIVLTTILRAGLPLVNGFLTAFDKAESGFVTAYRKYINEKEFEVKVEYMSAPKLDNKILILSDPMLATGTSMLMGYKALLRNGRPKHTHIVAVLATDEAIEYLKKNIDESEITIWTAAIDPVLTSHSYISPGLGDAGDLAYGEKVDHKD